MSPQQAARLRTSARRDIARLRPAMLAGTGALDIRALRALRKRVQHSARPDRRETAEGYLRALLFAPELNGDDLSPMTRLTAIDAARFLERLNAGRREIDGPACSAAPAGPDIG